MRTSAEIATAYLGGDAAKSDLVAEIDAMVAAERKACAKIAADHAGTARSARILRGRGRLMYTQILIRHTSIEALKASLLWNSIMEFSFTGDDVAVVEISGDNLSPDQEHDQGSHTCDKPEQQS